MKTPAMQIAVSAGLASVLALTGATPSFAQMRTGTEVENGYPSQLGRRMAPCWSMP
jgi:hypothetical protein